MRGFPPLHILAFALAFAGFAYPLAKLTFARPAYAGMHVAQPTASLHTTSAVLRLKLAHPPSSLSVTLDGKELLPKAATDPLSQELKIALPTPAEDVDLFVNATWPEGTPDTAISVELEPDALETQSLTRWSSGGTLSELFSYHWKS